MTDLPQEHPLRQPHKKWLPWIAAGIVMAGVGAAWWFFDTQQRVVAHPETALFSHLDESRVLLADVFRSQDTEASISTPLEAAGLTIERLVNERPPNTRYPPRRMVTFTIAAYKHLDCEGLLTLEFFNNRLMEVDFRPDDPARYAPRLHRALPNLARTRTGQAELVASPLRVWSNVDLAKSKVGRSLGSDGLTIWQDLRLTAQRDDWDARFGAIPVPARR